ncbi:MAG: hypothetical protein BCS36_02085 [Desulfovibrio sp. MES5]|nr:MAG: hypothetical protein BCS36_02085 [Desulfovibrio sp. MES5]
MKARVPAGHNNLRSKDKPCFAFFKALATHALLPAARAAGGPNQINEKPPCPQGTEASSQRTGLLEEQALLYFPSNPYS